VTADVGALNYWTNATGPKTAVAAASRTGMFYSSDDSTRIAFSVGATATGTEIAVTSAAAAANTPVLTAGNTVNLAAATGVGANPPSCSPDIGFVGKVLFAAYCTGTNAATKAARLVTVPDGATPAPKRLDSATANGAASVQPFWSADATGAKVFVINSAATARGRIIFNGATRTEADLEVDTQDGLMLDDGSAVVYRVQNGAGTTKAIRRATAVAPPVITDLVATSAEGILAISRDQKHALYYTLAPVNGLVDIRALSTTPPPAPVDIVATAAGYPFGFTGNGTTVLYQTDVDAMGIGKLKAKPVAGGAEKDLAANMFDARPLKTGTGVIILDNPQDAANGQITTVDLKLTDAVTGGTPKLLADTVISDGFEVSGTRLVYARFAATGGGLFSIAVP
jgi:hypothetical protein